jgi:hypothetical protein
VRVEPPLRPESPGSGVEEVQRQMTRKLIVSVAALAMTFLGGSALAGPPDEDPTCGHGTQSGKECAGNNGEAGCDGIGIAGDHANDAAGDALGLVNDILGC